MPDSAWIVRPHPKPMAARRLLCVPYAGGSAAVFRGWTDRLSAEIALFQMPGRGSRVRDPLCRSVDEAAARAADELARLDPRPTAIFGHSLGALIAFEAARRLAGAGVPLSCLFVSGRRAPTAPETRPPMSDLADEPFVAEMQARYGAIPDAVLADRDLLALLLPGLRADVAVLESYRYRPGAPLDCPVVALGGTEDPHARPSELEPWQAETRAGFSLHLLPGAHFFLHSSQPELMSIIERTLAAPDSAARVA